ncbi:NAD(P)-dependent dehydrogenase (short-subunit alcohol dehydrogenase family) [Spinactinospora alkalitolerans]|uniref:NAD(P)-dependent dehydrogenase (Short-subunit alcohol dehydrogenase family) n=1 Tax=Spinactinospora alkalitolerans TaxID=687207 RepID=A0A852U9N2_9ACTN|nr:SDR family oxidoreductase [Spinactinospora alkalitolerans]NYE50660.1 NAD(P)-dependent dehydrogenase (short-subunit alcohol dehydrogenase family) [Spinactinospora alkalitolerans]
MGTGKTALVTGGSRGIGAATARRLARDGFDVALTYAGSKDRAHAVAEEIAQTGRRGLALQADSADPDAVRDAVDRTAAEFGGLDVLVNNAGIFPNGPLEGVTVEEIDRTLGIHVRAPFVAAQAAAGHMGAGGRIITIGSNLAEHVPMKGVVLYSASKSALIGMVRGLARDLGDRGITANLVNPGPTDTDMNPADGESADTLRGFSALGRYSLPEDIAAAVAHLAGEGGRNITGTVLTVDAGTNI